jgi:hypothetical protein
VNDEIKQAMRVLAEVCCWPLRHRGFCRFLWFSDVFHWVSVWFLISHTLFWILHFWGRGGGVSLDRIFRLAAVPQTKR